MLLFISFSILSLFSLSHAAPFSRRSDQPAPGACTGSCEGYMHDPMVVFEPADKTYYRFVTNNKLTIATAPSITGPWTDIGPVLPSGSKINLPGSHDLWAPDIFHDNNTYYLYYTVSVLGSQTSDIGVATSPALPGPWTDHGSLHIPPNPHYNLLDPNLLHTPTTPGKFYLTFGSFWTGIYQLTYPSPPLPFLPAPNPVNIQTNTSTPAGNAPKGSTEGAYQFWWPPYYYLFFSSGLCCNAPSDPAPPGEEYHVMACRSEHPDGPWFDSEGKDCLTESGGDLILASDGEKDVYAPGGQGVMWDEGLGSVVMYYHYAKPSVSVAYERFWFGWNKVSFEGGWPKLVA